MVTMLSKASEMGHLAALRGPPLVPSKSRNGQSRHDSSPKVPVASESCRYARTVSGNYCSTSGGAFSAATLKGVSKRSTRSLGLSNFRRNEANFGSSRVAESQEPNWFSEADWGFSSRKQEQRYAVRSAPEDGDVVLVEVHSNNPEIHSIAGVEAVVQGLSDGKKVIKVDADLLPISAVGLGAGEGDSAALLALTEYQPKLVWYAKSAEEEDKTINKAINAGIIAFAGTFALTTIFTVDHDYWHGWTLQEILQYAPQHNWEAYEALLRSNPIFAKMIISGTVYFLGDWIAQCFEGRSAFEFDRLRMFRSGLVGFCLHGSMSHFYYRFCEWLFPFHGWWVLPLKVLFDQTFWSGLWNSVYFSTLGLLRFESPINIIRELRTTFVPLLTAGWKLWPFAHLVTYGLIPVEQRLLWVDMVEIIWVTILAMYSNQNSEARIAAHDEIDLTHGAADGKKSVAQTATGDAPN